MQKHYKTMLTIAGSDPIGGAGIQADLKTAAALGVYGLSAITAITAQNSRGVAACEAVSPDMLRRQLRTVADDACPDAVKIGMLPTVESARVVAEFLEDYRVQNVVIDPVMAATSGHILSLPETLPMMRGRLMPLATLITPNIPEAEILVGHHDEIEALAKKLAAMSGTAILVKGGHSAGDDDITDVLATLQEIKPFSHRRILTRNSHGTGCTLSSAIASCLALGEPLVEAVGSGIDYLQKALAAGAGYSFGRGEGHGPVMHFFNHK